MNPTLTKIVHGLLLTLLIVGGLGPTVAGFAGLIPAPAFSLLSHVVGIASGLSLYVTQSPLFQPWLPVRSPASVITAARIRAVAMGAAVACLALFVSTTAFASTGGSEVPLNTPLAVLAVVAFVGWVMFHALRNRPAVVEAPHFAGAYRTASRISEDPKREVQTRADDGPISEGKFVRTMVGLVALPAALLIAGGCSLFKSGSTTTTVVNDVGSLAACVVQHVEQDADPTFETIAEECAPIAVADVTQIVTALATASATDGGAVSPVAKARAALVHHRVSK